jgi:excisionase family DNA binding protein
MTIGTVHHELDPSGSALAELGASPTGSVLPNSDWLTTKEVARYLRCSPKTVLRLRLPCARVGLRLRLYRKADVTMYLERRVG